MESTKYAYSLKKNLLVIIAGLIFMVILLYAIIIHLKDPHIFISIVPVFLVMGWLTVYICKKVYFPYLRGETALELNDDRLEDYSEKKIIYWRDVDSINTTLPKKDSVIIFRMKDGAGDISISTKYISGDDKDIYATVMNYFEAKKKS